MDVLVLIDKLDDLVHNAKAVPLTDQVRIDREEIYDILDQMRATIPEEIKQARWIVKERQEMLAEAKRECDRILGEAREQAAREASQTEIVKLAERQAQEIIDEARRQARETRLEMEDWADGILSTLEVNLDKFLSAVKRGRERLHERSQETVVASDGRLNRRPDRTSPASAEASSPAPRRDRRRALRRSRKPPGAGGSSRRARARSSPTCSLFGGDVAAGALPARDDRPPPVARSCPVRPGQLRTRHGRGRADGPLTGWAAEQLDEAHSSTSSRPSSRRRSSTTSSTATRRRPTTCRS